MRGCFYSVYGSDAKFDSSLFWLSLSLSLYFFSFISRENTIGGFSFAIWANGNAKKKENWQLH